MDIGPPKDVINDQPEGPTATMAVAAGSGQESAAGVR